MFFESAPVDSLGSNTDTSPYRVPAPRFFRLEPPLITVLVVVIYPWQL